MTNSLGRYSLSGNHNLRSNALNDELSIILPASDHEALTPQVHVHAAAGEYGGATTDVQRVLETLKLDAVHHGIAEERRKRLRLYPHRAP